MALDCSLFHPYEDFWQTERRYARRAPRQLELAFAHMDQVEHVPIDAEAVRRIAEPLATRDHMSVRQKMVACYLYAQALHALRRYDEAIPFLVRARGLADDLPSTHRDPVAVVYIEHLTGTCHGIMLRYARAASHHRAAVHGLRALAEGEPSLDPALECKLLVALASALLIRADFANALVPLQEVEDLNRDAITPQQLASWNWVCAMHYRWQKQPAVGVPYLDDAASVYGNVASSFGASAAARFYCAAAELVFDIAELYPDGGLAFAHRSWMSMAVDHINRAASIYAAPTTDDAVGHLLLRLSRARQSRLRAPLEPTIGELEAILAAGSRLNDIPVRVQALTEMGLMHSVRNETAAAQYSFRQALATIGRQECEALGLAAAAHLVP